MAKYVIYSDAPSVQLRSASGVYATARSGGTVTLGASVQMPIGQYCDGYPGTFYCMEATLSFDTSVIPASEDVSSSSLMLSMMSVMPTGTTDVYERDFGATIETTDYVAGAALGGLLKVASFPRNVSGNIYQMLSRITAGSATRLLLASSTHAAGVSPYQSVPNNDDSVNIYSSDASGTATDPTLTVFTTVRSCLTTVGNSLAQASDGTWISMRSDGAAIPVVTLASSPDGQTWTTIATVPTGALSTQFDVTDFHGPQVLSMCIDDSDNIYVIGYQGNTKYLAGKCYVKTIGSLTWTARTLQSANTVCPVGLTGYALEAVWSPTSGNLLVGIIGVTTGPVVGYTLVNVSSGLKVEGASFSYNQSSVWADTGLPDGGGACVFKNPSSSLYPVMMRTIWSEATRYPMGRTFSSSVRMGDPAGVGLRYGGTGESKVRAVPTGLTTVDFLYDDSAGPYLNAGCFAENQFFANGDSASYSAVRDAATSSTTQNQPVNSKVSQTLKWDAFYDPGANKIWVYYLDTTDSRKLHRTAFSLISNTWLNNDVIVSNTVGAVGSSNLAVRCVQNPKSMSQILVEVANVSSTLVHSVISVIDIAAVAPYTATLNQPANFDKTFAQTLSWIFNDSNVLPEATAYQVEISNATTGATAVNTGKVASAASLFTLVANTLANEIKYMWRVTTWNGGDIASPVTNWQEFYTSATPVVTITSPAAPLTTTDKNWFDVTWTYAQVSSPQFSYRVVVTRTSDGNVQSDSGALNGTELTYRAGNLATGVSNTITVTATSSKGVSSVPKSQTVSPVFLSSDTPTFVATVIPGKGVKIDITNPTPTGNRPLPTHNQLWSTNQGNNYEGQAWLLFTGVAGSCDGEPGYPVEGDYSMILDNIPLNSTVYDYGVVSSVAAGGAPKSETYFVRAVSV